MKKLLLCVFLLTAEYSMCQEDKFGSITARVVDQAGNPIKDAIVMAQANDNRPAASVVPECLSDDAGICTIAQLEYETYNVSGMKEADGYPNPKAAIYEHNTRWTVVSLQPSSATPTITVILGPKAAILDINLIDDLTSSPIKNGTATIERASAPNVFFSTNASDHCTILVPSDEDIVLNVTEKEHARWNLTLDGGSKPLHLSSGDVIPIGIRMKSK